MATTYFETATDSDLDKNTVTAPAISSKLLQTAPGSASSLTITLPSSGSGEFWFITEPGDPGTTGGTDPTGFTVSINVTTANMNISRGGAHELHRLNSSGVVQATRGFDSTSTWPQSTGVKSWTDSVGITALGTFGATDRLGVKFPITNGAMSTQSIVIEVGLANGNEEVIAPWTFAAVPKSFPHRPAHWRRRHLVNR